MSALSDSVDRVVAAVGKLQGAFDVAKATEVTDTATIADLQSQVDAAVADAAAEIAVLATVLPEPVTPPPIVPIPPA